MGYDLPTGTGANAPPAGFTATQSSKIQYIYDSVGRLSTLTEGAIVYEGAKVLRNGISVTSDGNASPSWTKSETIQT